MAEERVERRLAAILAADVVGYSAFVGQDEEGTIRALKGHLSALEPIIGLHAGRIVKFVGDGFLAEFGSVVDAVSCADAMQRRLAERNGDRPHDQCLHFRMGIHVGDIIVDGDDILGDGVNVAARLESIAKPGGITVSARVYEDVERNLDLAFADLGARELKNIARPVRIYEVVRDTREVERTILELPDKPSIAVLPFLNMSADLEQEYLADGLTEDIISALSYVPWIFVIARNSSFTYKGLSVDVRKIGRELGVRYLLEGSVRRSGDRLRVTGQLVDAKTSAHIWADHFDGTLKDVFDLQDRMTEAVVNAIAPKIRESEIERAGRKHPESLTAYDLYLRALAALNNIQITEASILLDNAIAATSDYAKAKAVRAWCYTLFSWGGVSPNDEDAANAVKLAETALASANADPEVWAYSGYTIGFFGNDTERGMSLVEEATRQCPSFAWAWTSIAMLEYLYGTPVRALERVENVLRLSPRDPQAFRTFMVLSGAHRLLQNYEQAIEYAREGLRLNPKVIDFHITQIACLVWLKRPNEAGEAVQKLLVRIPEFRITAYLDGVQRFPAFSAELRDALHTAGVPN
jgi:adenylate cyclase